MEKKYDTDTDAERLEYLKVYRHLLRRGYRNIVARKYNNGRDPLEWVKPYQVYHYVGHSDKKGINEQAKKIPATLFKIIYEMIEAELQAIDKMPAKKI